MHLDAFARWQTVTEAWMLPVYALMPAFTVTVITRVPSAGEPALVLLTNRKSLLVTLLRPFWVWVIESYMKSTSTPRWVAWSCKCKPCSRHCQSYILTSYMFSDVVFPLDKHHISHPQTKIIKAGKGSGKSSCFFWCSLSRGISVGSSDWGRIPLHTGNPFFCFASLLYPPPPP